MKRKPSLIDSGRRLRAVDGRALAMDAWIVMTIAAEKKKLSRVEHKAGVRADQLHESAGDARGDDLAALTACDMRPLTAIRPAAGAMVRTATDCAGMKNADTAASAKKIA